jgi:hypothetical protein
VSDAMIETETAGVELGAGEAVPVRDTALPAIYAEITRRLNPHRRHRSCPRAVKRARHNSYRIKKRDEPASIRHDGPATIRHHTVNPRAA